MADTNNDLTSWTWIKTRYPNDPAKDIYKAAKSGDSLILSKILQRLSSSEITTAIERISIVTTEISLDGQHIELQYDTTALITAAENGNLDCVKTLLRYNADIEGRGNFKLNDARFYCTALFAAASKGHVDVLSCFVINGADVNAGGCFNNVTPLMIASLNGHVDVVSFLVEHGANIDLQGKTQIDTALHYAVRGEKVKVAEKRLSLGASQLPNSRRLTPLLLASNERKISVVEDFINGLEYSKEQRIETLELLGASLATQPYDNPDNERAFEYMKRGLEERFQDPLIPLLKQPVEPIEAYQNRKECQTLEELAQIQGDFDAIIMESLVVRERILGSGNQALILPLVVVADLLELSASGNFDICLALNRYAMKKARCCNLSLVLYFQHLTEVFFNMVENNIPPRQTEKVILELIEETALEYEKQERQETGESNDLFGFLLGLFQYSAEAELFEDDQDPRVLVLWKKLSSLNPRNYRGDTLLHLVSENLFQLPRHFLPAPFEHPCPKTMKFLLRMGMGVNAVNNNRDTPLHRAVTFEPVDEEICFVTGMLNVSLDGGAHIDFVNDYGQTAMDMARTDEARRILSERKTLELKCIAAKAVKRFGLPYMGEVPKTLERFISMH